MYTFHTDEDVESDIVFISCGNMDVWDATSMDVKNVGLDTYIPVGIRRQFFALGDWSLQVLLPWD